MATYTSPPVKATRPDTPNMNPNSKNTIFIILFAAAFCVGGYAWKDMHDQVNGLQKDVAALKARATTNGRRGGAAAIGTDPTLGAVVGLGGRGGRRGGNPANTIANLGLDDATTTQLTDLATQRQTLLQAAQLEAQNQGITRQSDPQGYQDMLDAATATVDGQIAAISPDALTALQAQGQRGRGGRRGGGGGA